MRRMKMRLITRNEAIGVVHLGFQAMTTSLADKIPDTELLSSFNGALHLTVTENSETAKMFSKVGAFYYLDMTPVPVVRQK